MRWVWNNKNIIRERGSGAILIILVMVSLGFIVLFAVSEGVLHTYRITGSLQRSIKIREASLNGATEAILVFQKERPREGVLPTLTIDGVEVTRSIATNGDISTITVQGREGERGVNIIAECARISGQCTILEGG